MITGTYGVDSSTPTSPDTIAQVKASGGRFWFRYSAGTGNDQPDTQFKLCQPGEIAALAAAGVQPVANFELAGDTPTLGAAAGHDCGQADLEFWRSRGLPAGSTIYLSWEPGNDPAQWPQVEAFLTAYDAALGGQYRADGLYAGIPTLVEFSKRGLIRHGWIPEGASCSVTEQPIAADFAPPAKTNWDLWFPTKGQVAPATSYLLGLLAGHRLETCVWQTGNKWLAGQADEDLVIIGAPAPSAPAAPAEVSAVPVRRSPYHGQPWPGPVLRFGPDDHFGNINGPATSHGGYYPAERPYVQMIQRQLIYGGFVPGVTDPYSGWADGIFDVRGHGLTGPTTDAVTRFQRALRANDTTLWGQVWADDWATLFGL